MKIEGKKKKIDKMKLGGDSYDANDVQLSR